MVNTCIGPRATAVWVVTFFLEDTSIGVRKKAEWPKSVREVKSFVTTGIEQGSANSGSRPIVVSRDIAQWAPKNSTFRNHAII